VPDAGGDLRRPESSGWYGTGLSSEIPVKTPLPCPVCASLIAAARKNYTKQEADFMSTLPDALPWSSIQLSEPEIPWVDLHAFAAAAAGSLVITRRRPADV